MFETRKQQGEWVELQFMARASANGFTVSKPWGDSSRYDFAIEKEGRFQRVQVKSTASREGASYACNVIWSAPNGRSRRYSRKDVDFFAILVIPDEAWYLIPAQVACRRTSFFLNPRNPRNRYFKYLEAWHLLKQAATTAAHARAHVPQ